MMNLFRTLEDIRSLAAITWNPTALILDRLGLCKKEYRFCLKNGQAIFIRPGSGDRYSVLETFVRDVYHRALALVSVNGTVIDVGANIGCFTLKAVQHVGLGGKVIAVEPSSETFEQLRKNIEFNSANNVVLIKRALGKKRGSIELRGGGSALFTSIYSEVNGKQIQGPSEVVDMFTLEDLLSEQEIETIDLLKLDCEGAEYNIMQVPSRYLEKIKAIVAELHVVRGSHPDDLIAFLESKGYEHEFDGEIHYFLRLS